MANWYKNIAFIFRFFSLTPKKKNGCQNDKAEATQLPNTVIIVWVGVVYYSSNSFGVVRLTCMFICFFHPSLSEGERTPDETARPLKFESRFESGNLRKAIQVEIKQKEQYL